MASTRDSFMGSNSTVSSAPTAAAQRQATIPASDLRLGKCNWKAHPHKAVQSAALLDIHTYPSSASNVPESTPRRWHKTTIKSTTRLSRSWRHFSPLSSLSSPVLPKSSPKRPPVSTQVHGWLKVD